MSYKKRNIKRKSTGFANTKRFPHVEHPAHYRYLDNRDNIEYLTFTHTPDVVIINGIKYEVIPLSSNINPKERGKSKSYVFPRRFVGKRSALGKENKNYSLTNEDKKTVDNLFKELPTVKVKYSNKNKK